MHDGCNERKERGQAEGDRQGEASGGEGNREEGRRVRGASPTKCRVARLRPGKKGATSCFLA